MISINSSNATKSLWLNDVAKAIFLASLKSVKEHSPVSPIQEPGSPRNLSGHATDQIHIFWLLPLVPITINVG